jgi:hypothetical protein
MTIPVRQRFSLLPEPNPVACHILTENGGWHHPTRKQWDVEIFRGLPKTLRPIACRTASRQPASHKFMKRAKRKEITCT